MKINQILGEGGKVIEPGTPEYAEDQKRRIAEVHARQAMIQAEIKARKEAQMCKVEHVWVETSHNQGLTRYKCNNCPATKSIDSSG